MDVDLLYGLLIVHRCWFVVSGDLSCRTRAAETKKVVVAEQDTSAVMYGCPLRHWKAIYHSSGRRRERREMREWEEGGKKEEGGEEEGRKKEEEGEGGMRKLILWN